LINALIPLQHLLKVSGVMPSKAGGGFISFFMSILFFSLSKPSKPAA
jgi:hypothetical protein